MIKGSSNNIGNVTKLGGLLEDVRDAMMEYQVCMSLDYHAMSLCSMSEPDFIRTRHLQQELSAHREFHPLRPPLVLSQWRTEISGSRHFERDASRRRS